MARGTQEEIEAATRAFHAAEAAWNAAMVKHYGREGSQAYLRARYEIKPRDYSKPVRRAWAARDAARRLWESAAGIGPKVTPGEAAYLADCEAQPTYHDGTTRRPWSALGAAIQDNWERYPTPR